MVCFPASLLRLARCLLCSLCVGGWTAQKGGRAARQKRACAWIQSNNAFLRSSQLRNVPLSPAVGCVGVTGYRYAFRLHHSDCDCAVRWGRPRPEPRARYPYSAHAACEHCHHAVDICAFCPGSASQLLREVAKVNFSASGIAELVQADKGKFGWLLAGVLGPYVGTQIWWRTCYHSWGAEPGVDTTKYIRWTDGKDGKEGALGRYYKNRRIPMCDLYEHYIEGKFDWNEVSCRRAAEEPDACPCLVSLRHCVGMFLVFAYLTSVFPPGPTCRFTGM